MLRRCLLFLFLSIFLIHFINASYNTFSLRRYFKNDSWAGIGAFCVSFLIIYLLNKSGFDFNGLFFSFGFSENLLYSILPIIFLIGVWLWNKGNKGNTVRVNNWVKPMDKVKNVSGSSSPFKPSGWIHGGKVLNLDMVERKKAWQKKLNALYEDNARLAKRNNGRIPARGTSDGERRAKNMKSIKVLENLIRSQ